MLAVLGLIFGIVVGVLIDPTVPTWLQPFLPVAVVAGLDALLGAGRAWLEGTFRDRVFVMSSLLVCWSSWGHSLGSVRQ